MKINKKVTAGLLLTIAIAPSALADKPEWAGSKGKPDQQQVEAHRAEMKAKGGDAEKEMNDAEEHADDKKMKKEKKLKQEKEKKQKQMREHQDDAEMKGEEMKQERAMEQAQSGKAAEQTQSQGKSKKWWNFWGGEEE